MLTVLLSVSDKAGIVPLANSLSAMGARLLSTGGTAKHLKAAGLSVTDVSEMTDFPEIFNGRVKTLHPKIHGGILGRRDQDEAVAKQHGIDWIDCVVCNLYPFAEVLKKGGTDAELIENIDIGGPTLIRAAAKNHQWVTVLTDPSQYDNYVAQVEAGESHQQANRQYAAAAFRHVAAYDALIADYFTEEALPDALSMACEKVMDCRYGENPHQAAALYRYHQAACRGEGALFEAKYHQGKPMSYNNYADADAALGALAAFTKPACVIVKHQNPCGVAMKDSIDDAFQAAWAADDQSAFGGVIALNQSCTEEIATFLSKVFIELILAPDFTDSALSILSKKPNLRVISVPLTPPEAFRIRPISGGLLMQSNPVFSLELKDCVVMTKNKPTDEAMQEAWFAFCVVSYVRSNAIAITRDQTTVGIGPGQVSRVQAVETAISKAGDQLAGTVLASDAFFPFPDSIERIAEAGIKTIIQPGGSVKDDDVIAACDRLGLTMIFTQKRVFLH